MLNKHETMTVDTNHKLKRETSSQADLNLKAETFRLQTQQCLKTVSYIWNLNER